MAQPERRLVADPRPAPSTSSTSAARSRRRWPRCRGCASGSCAALGRLRPPVWRPDPEFDLDYHVRHVALPPPGTSASCSTWCPAFYQDPYDRTRPLWMFHVIDGLEGGRSALLWKIHHSVADGIGRRGGSPSYHLQRSRQAPAAAAVDLSKLVAGGAGGRRRRGRRPGSAAGRRAPHRRAHVAAPSRHRPAARRRGGDVGSRPDRGPATPPPASSARCNRLRTQLLGEATPGGSPLWTAALTAPPPRGAAGPARRRQGRGQGPRRHAQRLVRHRRRERRPRLPRPRGVPRSRR